MLVSIYVHVYFSCVGMCVVICQDILAISSMRHFLALAVLLGLIMLGLQMALIPSVNHAIPVSFLHLLRH